MKGAGTLRSIAVPVDGSKFAEHAVPVAAAIARAARARLRLVLVHQLPPPPHDRDSAKLYVSVEVAVRKSQRDYLRAIAARLRESHGIQVTTLVPDGPVGPSLATWIHDSDADLVVMATHGRGALGRAVLGSIADYLVRSLSVPVLLVRPGAVVAPEAVAPEADRWTPREIVVGLDGSKAAEATIAPAGALARIFEIALTLVQVIPPLATATAPPLAFPVGYDERITDMRRREAQDYLENVAERLRGEGHKATPVAVIGESPAATLLDLGRAERGSLLAVATRGRGGARRLMLGSVADKLVRGAEVPVLVVPPARRA